MVKGETVKSQSEEISHLRALALPGYALPGRLCLPTALVQRQSRLLLAVPGGAWDREGLRNMPIEKAHQDVGLRVPRVACPPVLAGRTAGRASSGTQTDSVFPNSTSCRGFSIVHFCEFLLPDV